MNTFSIPQQHLTSSSTARWKQLWSLVALYASVVIGWIAYQNYQPKLLVKFNFTDFTILLVAVEAIILVITPPLAGRLGDRYRFKQGHRIPVIMAGISFAAMIFMAVAFTLFSNPGEIFKWILPVLIVLWLIAMSIFTSPALSTMELFVPVDKLPKAMAIMTIVANLIYAIEPVIVDIIDTLGAPLTFITGGVVVLLSGYALKKNLFDLFSTTNNKESFPVDSFQKDNRKSRYGMIMLLGTALGLCTTILFNVFPQTLDAKLSDVTALDGKLQVVMVLLLSAVLSLPVSTWVNKLGLEKSFYASAIVSLLSMAGIIWLPGVWVVLLASVVFAISFTALSISALPLALKNSNYYEKVFCVGIFFSGVALPDGVVELLQVI
ncbi:MFS transporter [Pseudochryseolinea flava]|nr:MFS transporter [Pseudochryseolinea flava]